MLNKFFVESATIFGLGKIKKAPGTIGSFFVAFFFYTISRFINSEKIFIFLPIFIFIIFFWGIYSSSMAEKYYGHDAPCIIIDELVGQLTAFLFLKNIKLWQIILGFAFFRFFDILKPLFINHLQKFDKGWGIMLDDLLAGVYSLFFLQIISFIIGRL